MDIFVIAVFLACFGSVGLLVLWCDSVTQRKGR